MNQRFVMGTFLTLSISAEQADRLTRVFLDDVQRLDERLSKFIPESDVSRINRAAGQETVSVHDDVFQLIQQALDFADQSDGAFDPTLQPFGYRRVQLDREAKTVFLPDPGMTLDLGGIAKGFALDHALAAVRRQGIPESVCADFGGQLLFWHRRGDFAPEAVQVEDPVRRTILDTFHVTTNCSVSTSSTAERPGHLRNPVANRPALSHGYATVVAATGIEAEAWSTAFFVQGRYGRHQCL